ncbi:signal transducing adapter molecule 1 [Drosophila subpulchrella]|uniref:signal transducing adapter molecule 1 n=1 Tax=Drosophila subpulchrella TaxID=1486046 RepID=UPI0018A12D3C|nr:signal transducing adapter molecule 1 [Drosophila subpulchrella]
MGIFGQSSPFDADVEKATSETNTNDNWSLILDVCDKVSTNPRLAKDCLKAVMRRMGHTDPHVVMQAITLLDALSNNCGKPFHLEVASRDFETEFRRLLGKAQPKVSLKMRQVLKNWADNDYKNDRELDLIPALYTKLRLEGYDFKNLGDKASKTVAEKAAALPKDPNVVSSQQEEDDIAKAIELSLKENKGSPKTASGASTGTASAYPSLYPSFGGATSTAPSSEPNATPAPEPRKVRALYDFEAAEENELTFVAGEIIHVLDDSDPNWWKGYNQRGEGLFPSNFVTADLSVDPERLDINQQHKSAAAAGQRELDSAAALQQKTEAAAAAAAAQPVEIDESKIDRLLHLLHEANPEDPSQDSNEMLQLEQEVHQMGPLIDAELERVDRKHAQLTQLSSDLVDAINLYHTLMRDDRVAAGQFAAAAGGFMPGLAGFPGAALYGAPSYPAAGGFPPAQNYPGMHSLPYGPVPNPPNGAPSQAPGAPGGYLGQPQGQVPLPYQNGHAAQMNSLPAHLTQPAGAAPLPQPIYSQPTPVTTQQQQPLPQHPQQPPQHPQQPPQHPQNSYHIDPQAQYAQVPPAVTQIQQPQQPPAPHAYMSPQHQQPPPPQGYQPGPNLYAPNGSPAVNPQSYMSAQQHQQQQAPQQHPPHDQFSQLHQQMAMSMAGGPPVGPSGYHMQNDAVKNNIPIYQQQR